MYTLKIDNRERDLIASLKQLKIEFEIQALDLGDIQLWKINNPNPLFIIERKTWADLNASIKDGRYREQKARLKSHRQQYGTRLLYIFEESGGRSVKAGTLLSCCLNTALRDEIPVQQTNDLKGTCTFILQMLKNVTKWKKGWDTASLFRKEAVKDTASMCRKEAVKDTTTPSLAQASMFNTETELEYSSTLRSKKKENLTPGVCFIRQLSTIPGCSATIASHIKELYGSMSVLIMKYVSIEDDELAREQLLKDIKINGKRLGKIRSKRIYKYLFT